MNEELMLSGHIQATVERAKATDGEYLLAAEDTTYSSFRCYAVHLDPPNSP